VSATNNNRLVEVKDGDTIDHAVWGDKLNLRAEFNDDSSDSSPRVDSVRFWVNGGDGDTARREVVVPYSLASNRPSGAYIASATLATPTNSVTIEAVPYWNDVAGSSYTVTIRIVGVSRDVD